MTGGWAATNTLRKHWVSGPHCPGYCKTGDQWWMQPA